LGFAANPAKQKNTNNKFSQAAELNKKSRLHKFEDGTKIKGIAFIFLRLIH
jgi:hypothetical protein